HPELEEWLTANNIEYMIRPTFMAENEDVPIPCSRCTWNRRRTLFEMADELGCNKLAFGHHLDDLAETALLNLTYHGKNETMRPVREYFDGRISMIRPLMYVPEHELKRFSRAHDFPPPPSMCPRGEHTQRKRMKEIVAELERECHGATWNITRSALSTMGILPPTSQTQA
ncbi:MAG TPA: ATP-binding protein, partial [Armatimonadota bacterium]